MENILGTITWHIEAQELKLDHLAHRSSRVKVGQAVAKGHVIAEVGMTGYTFRPHLHFQVVIYTGTNVWMDFDTVSVQGFGS
jgi:hypothetical protein